MFAHSIPPLLVGIEVITDHAHSISALIVNVKLTRRYGSRRRGEGPVIRTSDRKTEGPVTLPDCTTAKQKPSNPVLLTRD